MNRPTTTVGVIDTRLCNIDSLSRAAVMCGAHVVRVCTPSDLDHASHIIIPGVGAFSAAMANITSSGVADAVRRQAEAGTPILGICLGMQMLGNSSEEGGRTDGLGLISGKVVRLEPLADEAIPHIGWNEVRFVANQKCLNGIQTSSDFYFVHSYRFVPDSPADILGMTPYCGDFASIIAHDNVVGVQFHPEKSMKNGLQLLRNFLSA
jgi:glutamine amidotransferase